MRPVNEVVERRCEVTRVCDNVREWSINSDCIDSQGFGCREGIGAAKRRKRELVFWKRYLKEKKGLTWLLAQSSTWRWR